MTAFTLACLSCSLTNVSLSTLQLIILAFILLKLSLTSGEPASLSPQLILPLHIHVLTYLCFNVSFCHSFLLFLSYVLPYKHNC